MPNKMLIDASHQEETRVVVVRGNRIEEFDFESQDKKQLKGNIYLARVTRVEPSLQAAFVEYGGNRHGFLAFSEIHPDYYQIPVADRQALLRAEAEDAAAEDEDEEAEERGGRNRRRRRPNRGRPRDDQKAASEGTTGEDAGTVGDAADSNDESQAEHVDEDRVTMAQAMDADVVSEGVEDIGDDSDSHDETDSRSDHDHHDDEVVSVGAGDAIEEVRERRRAPRRTYKIQEVVKRRQILLVQVVKEERGNKGAALTTYLSLAGRYSVLMPNTARGGGISRKITNAQDRKRLKDVVKDLDVPQGMGVILRTAGESRTKAEIKRDYEYLMRMWDNVRSLTLQSSAPALVYEEGSLIKRSVRDLYNKDIDEILVAGEDGYREAKDFMRMLMPSHAKVVQPFRDSVPIFARNGIEAQLDKMVQPQVTLKSGGYIIINQTEALVAIDVNSGRSTKEHSIEDTALQTNLEAAEEVARQLRLRDLAGLIVIDFIDMEENRNNRAVEKRLKDHLKNDRARIQVGRISHFGLLEMSRQRIRASVLESTMQTCPHCGGTGHIRSESSVGLLVVRAIEEFLLKESRHHITVRTPASTAIYVLNHKRANLVDLENRFGLTITVEADETVRSQHYAILKGAISERPANVIVPVAPPVYDDVEDDDIVEIEDEPEEAVEIKEKPETASAADQGDGTRKKRRRRRRRGGRDRQRDDEGTTSAGSDAADLSGADDDGESDDEDAPDAIAAVATADAPGEDGQQKKRRRGKRGGKRNKRDDEADGEAPDGADEAVVTVEAALLEPTTDDAAMAAVEGVAEVSETEAKPARRKSRAKKPAEPEVAEAAADLAAEPVAENPAAKPKPRRAPRKKVEAVAVQSETVDEVAETTAAASAPGEANPAAEAPTQVDPVPADTPEKRQPAVASEPLLTSSSPVAESEQPRKVGWWQRKGFL
jgi:ribonuclease E